MSATLIYCSPRVRELWPIPLASQWARLYPQLFDRDDIRITRRQPRNHFCEWFAAIHLFHRDGTLALVEKYVYGTHSRKQALLNQLLSKRQQTVLRAIGSDFAVQPPDLLVYRPGTGRFGFAEVKGPGDRLRDAQVRSHKEIERRLRVGVEVITVRVVAHAAA